MAWHLPYRLTTLHYAVSAALLCAVGTATLLPTAKAATIGKTTITSAQHEPLVAVIGVSDIQASDFSANLASSVVYQQLGLIPTDSMSVNFVRTSATTGQVVISTSQPLSKPFADVVLNITDNGQRNVIPKTLLMPLGASAPIKTPNRVIASATKPNLPVISATPIVSTKPIAPVVSATNNTKPLALKRGAPPPLFEFSSASTATQAQNSAQANTNKVLPAVSVATAPSLPMPQSIASSNATAARLSSGSRTALQLDMTAMTTDNTSSLPNTKTLNIQNSRRITARANSQNPNNNLSSTSVASVPNNATNATNATISDNTNTSTTAARQNVPTPTNSAINVQQNIVNQTVANTRLSDNRNALNDKTPIKDRTLNIEVTRQITVRNSPINKVDSTDSPSLALKFDESIASLDVDRNKNLQPESLVTPTADSTADTLENKQATDLQTTLANSATTSSNNDTTSTTSEPMISYTVQRNDNLWVISKQIAEKNNLDVATVMSQIKKQNPNAFINQDADQLKADAQLRLPNYEVVPSENSIQAAIAAQRARYLQTKKVTDSQSDQPEDKPLKAIDSTDSAIAKESTLSKQADIKPNTKSSKDTIKKTTQTLPQARFSVIAPAGKGKADGTQVKSATATGRGLDDSNTLKPLDNQILSSLKSSRKRTAAQAQKVRSSNQTLSSYTQKLKLQNQKLAELEARLKKLRNQ